MIFFAKYGLYPTLCILLLLTLGWCGGIIAAAGLYVAAVAVLAIVQEKVLYLRPRRIDAAPSAFFPEYTEAVMTPKDAAAGENVCGWFIPDGQKDAPTVLYCHGIARNISHRLPVAAVIRRAGANVFLFDYRGYGKSAGTPSEEKMYADARSAWDYLTSVRNIAPEHIFIHGHSLGSGVAAALTAHLAAAGITPAGLIMEAAFTSMPAIAQRVLPYIPARWLCRPRFDNVRNLQDAKCPVLFLHSIDDELIPLKMGCRLYMNFPGEKTFAPLTGSHDLALAQTDTAAAALAEFFTASLSGGEKTMASALEKA